MKNKFLLIPIIVICAMTLTAVAGAATWYVANNGNDPAICPSPGTQTWASPFQTIHGALTCSIDGDEIWVKTGIYDLSASIQISKSIQLYGGFLGNETERNQRDWTSFPTSVDGMDTVRCFNLLYVSGALPVIVIDGFNIAHGRSNNGGGMYIGENLEVTVFNCDFHDNYTTGNGGAVYLVNARYPLFRKCTFRQNYSKNFGGALYNTASRDPVIEECLFSQNDNCTDCDPGGWHLGGAIYSAWKNITIENCSFEENITRGMGGAVAIYDDDTFGNTPPSKIINSVFYSNDGLNGTGAIYIYDANPIITHCNIVMNRAPSGSGGLLNILGLPVITNSLFFGNRLWDNTPSQIENPNPSYECIVTYSLIEGGYAGDGNVDELPMFEDGQWHLSDQSPCVDAGTVSAPELPATDFEGNPRILGAAPDMGVDELGYFCQGDFLPADGDVDGADLAILCANPEQVVLSVFTSEFGRINCILP